MSDNQIIDISLYGYNTPLNGINIATYGYFRGGMGIDIGVELITNHAERSQKLLVEQFRRDYNGVGSISI